MTRQDDALIRAMTPYFRRNYAPQHAFADAVAMLQMFPGLIGLWPGSAVGAAGLLNDLSGNGLAMTNNNSAVFSANTTSLIPWVEFNGSNQYFSLADTAILDIAGNEAYIASAINGITMGGWFWFDAVGATYGLISKWVESGDQRSYRLRLRSTNLVQLEISGNGVGADGVQSADAPALAASGWYFCVGRAPASGDMSAFVNGIESVGSPGTLPIFNSTAALEIGRTNGGSYLNGRSCLCFLCTAAVPNIFIETFYDWTRPLFGR